MSCSDSRQGGYLSVQESRRKETSDKMKRKIFLFCLVLFCACIFQCCDLFKLIHKEAKLNISFSPNPVNRSDDGQHHFYIILRESGGVAAILTRIDVYPGTWSSDPQGILGFTRIEASQTRSAYVNAWNYSSGTVLTFSFHYDDEEGNRDRVATGAVTLLY